MLKLIPLLLLIGCSISSLQSQYQCPHPAGEVEQARDHVRSIERLSWSEINSPRSEKACDSPGNVRACVDVFYRIKVYEDAPDESLHHELCHVYESAVLGKRWETTRRHEGWKRQ